MEWFNRIISLDSDHVEAISNLAATLYCLNRQEEAEEYWLKAIKARPQYLEAVEHLVGLLYKKKSLDAVEVINFVQKALQLPTSQSESVGSAAATSLAAVLDENLPQPGFGSSGYAIPGSENGRILALVHAKGTMLYSMKDIPGASKAFEEAVLISTGRRTSSIQTLVRQIQQIFQDAMSSGTSSNGLLRKPTGVGDILALYYLSLSLQESPSTANNVGILLASVQQPAAAMSPGTLSTQPNIPGIPPGSGLSLALAYYNYGLLLDPKHVHLHTNLGSLLKDIGQLDLAIQMYEQAVQCDGNFDIALTNLANAVKDRGRVNDAITYYKRAVNSNPEFAEAVCGLSTALNSVCDWRGRGGALVQGGDFDRWHVDDDGMLVDARLQGRFTGLTKKVIDIVARQLEDASIFNRSTPA
ncbi:putative UDP-N-acetylglucosamine--peptide N-acetylglucosaminyltransferase SEC [Colletotrichum sp. SAR11_240]|nr:putative UDP-N-acetylglucosamine--peptide N-acetylglucosaminyltransferase SEC [Colletotrichum sp. SAR11_240]